MMRIGDLARQTGTPVATIRYYESMGLLPAVARTDANYRLYGTTHVERLSFIRNCRSLDMTLDEVASLLRFKDTPDADCAAVNTLLDEHLGHVAERIRTLRRLELQLRSLREVCRETQAAEHCQILAHLSRVPPREAVDTTRVAHTGGHVRGTHGHQAVMPAKSPKAAKTGARLPTKRANAMPAFSTAGRSSAR